MTFPPHKASLRLVHNDHHAIYVLAAEWIEQNAWCDWISDEQKAKAIAADSIWTLQWYPDTPVGFHALAAADLDVLLEAANA